MSEAVAAARAEATRKRLAAFDEAGSFVTNDPADVRWLLAGRGRPVSAGSSSYAVEVGLDQARVWYQDIERSRVESDERFDELDYTPSPYSWFEPLPVSPTGPSLQALRLALGPEEIGRYRRACAEAAGAFVAALATLTPTTSEREAAAAIAFELVQHGFTTPVLLAGGERRAPVHRHPLPTGEQLGGFALLAFTAEREGLFASMTRVVSFGSPPDSLRARVEEAASVDAAVLAAARPGRTLGELFTVIERAYDSLGRREEWRLHHQGGLTGYRGREVFATPGDKTVLPNACAVAFNPSVAGGGKSEDTVLVTVTGAEVMTVTPTLPHLANSRPAIVEL